MKFHMITMTNGELEQKFAFNSREELDEFRSAAREKGWRTHRMTPKEGVTTTTPKSALSSLLELEHQSET